MPRRLAKRCKHWRFAARLLNCSGNVGRCGNIRKLHLDSLDLYIAINTSFTPGSELPLTEFSTLKQESALSTHTSRAKCNSGNSRVGFEIDDRPSASVQGGRRSDSELKGGADSAQWSLRTRISCSNVQCCFISCQLPHAGTHLRINFLFFLSLISRNSSVSDWLCSVCACACVDGCVCVMVTVGPVKHHFRRQWAPPTGP